MTQALTTGRPISVDELRRAWRAVQDGQFRSRPGRADVAPHRGEGAGPAWVPPGSVLPVLGSTGQAGATTVAVAIAAAAGAARVVECCAATVSGLSCAATAELGRVGNSWVSGRRDRVWLARQAQDVLEPGLVPLPDDPPVEVDLTVLDVGWPVEQVAADRGWLHDHVVGASQVVLVTRATVPALRRLEAALTVLSSATVVLAVRGVHPRRWPKPVIASLGPRGRAAVTGGPLVQVPTNKDLLIRGLDTRPLPPALVRAGHQLLRQVAVGHPYQMGLTP